MVAILIKSSVTWLCVQQLFQAAANDNIKALLLALCEGIVGKKVTGKKVTEKK